MEKRDVRPLAAKLKHTDSNMSLESTLKKAITHLRSGNLGSEAQVKQAVILPIIRALNWDDADPEEFIPEFSVNNKFVDYALLNHSNPEVFIEAKKVGAMDADSEKQLFGYASNRGVPLLILTDGSRWDFYLSMAAGAPKERRFYRLELELEHKIQEYVEFFEDHLKRDTVISGKARLNAEKRHESNRERERAIQTIPEAWQTLLSEPDEILRDLLAEKVESECGTKPELDDIEEFLKNLISDPLQPLPKSQRIVSPVPYPESKLPKPRRPTNSKIVGYILRGEKLETGTSINTLAEILIIFDAENPFFMENFAKKTVSRTRNLVAKNRNDLYEKSHLVDSHSRNLGNGWWIGTNLSKSQIYAHIRTACNIAKVGFGSDLRLIER